MFSLSRCSRTPRPVTGVVPPSPTPSAPRPQVELRILAHFSCDTGLCATLSDPAQDPFRMLAASWMGVAQDQVGGTGRGLLRLYGWCNLLTHSGEVSQGPVAWGTERGIRPGG